MLVRMPSKAGDSSHMRKLRAVKEPLASFLASGLFNLREKLGPIFSQNALR